MNDNKSQLLNAGITYVPKNGMGKNTNEFYTFLWKENEHEDEKKFTEQSVN